MINPRRNKRKNKARKAIKPLQRDANIYIDRFGPRRTNRYAFNDVWIESPMRYYDTFNVSIPVATVMDLRFRANSLFAPYYGGGHQPLGFDQEAAIYNRYVVDRLFYRVAFGACNQQISVGAGVINGAQTYVNVADFQEFCESPLVQNTKLPVNTGGPVTVLQANRILPPFIGVSHKHYLTDDRFQSIFSTNPIETIDFHVCAYNDTLVAATVVVSVSIHYSAILFDPVNPSISSRRRRQRDSDGISAVGCENLLNVTTVTSRPTSKSVIRNGESDERLYL